MECDVISLAPKIKKYLKDPSSKQLQTLTKDSLIKKLHAGAAYLVVTGYQSTYSECAIFVIFSAIIALYVGILNWLGY